jgi:hypothetical protein
MQEIAAIRARASCSFTGAVRMAIFRAVTSGRIQQATSTFALKSAGDCFFSSVPPARYTLTFATPNFQTETISAFEVAVAQAVTINATLKVGNVSQSITVEAAGTQVESSSAQLGTVIGERQ